MTTGTVVDSAKALASEFGEILPAFQVLHECHTLAEANRAVRELSIGHTEAGTVLQAYEFGQGAAHVLLYGFPDPGEAVGGTTILALLRGLVAGNEFLRSKDVTWHFIPCLNLDDQPDGGRSLGRVFRDRSIREVEWCVENPRSETSTLLSYVNAISPRFVFPLHDEYHCGESIPVYAIISEVVAPDVCEQVRTCLQSFGLRLRNEHPHKTMGTAFELATDYGEEYLKKSTFSRMARYGLVAVCEVSQQEGVTPASLVAAQIAVGMAVQMKRSVRADPLYVVATLVKCIPVSVDLVSLSRGVYRLAYDRNVCYYCRRRLRAYLR